VRIDGKWHEVPDEAVINEPNRDGRTIVWPMPVWEGDRLKIAIAASFPAA
jgi:hypothetical protein